MLESTLLRGVGATPEMRQVWSDATAVGAWLRYEQVLAQCQAQQGLVPEAVVHGLSKLSVADINMAALADEMVLVGRPIVGLVAQLRTLVGPETAKFVHFRATTQDVLDTGLALQMSQALTLIDAAVGQLIGHIRGLSKRFGHYRFLGRTNGQHAVPMALATKLDMWAAELRRRQAVLQDARSHKLWVQVGGPVGDLADYAGDSGTRLKARMAEVLGLGVVAPHWQNARDGIKDVVDALGSLCATICKLAHNVNALASSDIGEMREEHLPGKGVSSAMAHKTNQRASEFAEAMGRLGRHRATQMGELTQQEHERSGGVWIAEWWVVPEVFLLTDAALRWALPLFAGLTVDQQVMQERVDHHQKKLAGTARH